MKSNAVHLQVTLANHQLIGFFDGEYVQSNSGETLYRIDGEEIYTPGNGAKLLGYLRGNSAETIAGELLFTLSE